MTEKQLPWRGIHHIALATPDLDATLRFYGDVLGMSVSEIYPSRAGRGRHSLVFAKLNDSDTWGLHFFERSGIGSDSTPLLHIAFRLADESAANALRQRLQGYPIAITEIVELGSFLFADNNGLMLEVTYPQDVSVS
jgi:catechol 2,3-dioxygenase-like lactoylglutathione lyase family enzyme